MVELRMWTRIVTTLMTLCLIVPSRRVMILSLKSTPPSVISSFYSSILAPNSHMYSLRFPSNPFTKNKTAAMGGGNSLYRGLIKLKMSLREGSTSLPADLKEVIDLGPIEAANRVFVINGWRWHTISVARDLGRFLSIVRAIQRQKKEQQRRQSPYPFVTALLDPSAASTETSNSSSTSVLSAEERVLGCYKYMCGFNWKGLMRVESKIFFPWLSKLLPLSAKVLLEDIETQQRTVMSLTSRLGAEINALGSSGGVARSLGEDIRSYERIEVLLLEMQLCAARMQAIQNTIFVPFIAAFVDKRDQEVFNRRVITTLGLIDSQVHLVGMYDAIKNLPAELRLYERQIPRVARALMPVWRARLYLPQARYLETDAGAEGDSSSSIGIGAATREEVRR